jgi:hypothetical protein
MAGREYAKRKEKQKSWGQRIAGGVQNLGKASFNMFEGMGQGFAQPRQAPKSRRSKGKTTRKRTKKQQNYMDWIEKELTS